MPWTASTAGGDGVAEHRGQLGIPPDIGRSGGPRHRATGRHRRLLDRLCPWRSGRTLGAAFSAQQLCSAHGKRRRVPHHAGAFPTFWAAPGTAAEDRRRLERRLGEPPAPTPIGRSDQPTQQAPHAGEHALEQAEDPAQQTADEARQAGDDDSETAEQPHGAIPRAA
jgi:hypothetical protein